MAKKKEASRQLEVRMKVTDEEYDMIAKQAARVGMTMSTWLRMVMRERTGLAASP